MKKKHIVIVAVVVSLVIGGYILRQTRQTRPASIAEGSYKIGALLPQTGDGAAYGEPAQKVIQLAVEEINAAGGIDGKKLDMVFEDGKCDGKAGADAAQKLVNANRVQVIIGGICSGETIAAVPIAASGKVAMLSPAASSPDLTNINPLFARDYPSDTEQGRVLAQAAFNDKLWRMVAFITEQTDYAQGVEKAFQTTFEALGGKVVNEQFTTQTTDHRSPLAKLKATSPDALFISVQTPAAIQRVLTQLQNTNWKPSLMLIDIAVGDPKLLQGNKALLEGALSTEFATNASNPKFQHLVQAYKTKYNADMPFQGYMQTVYDAVYLVKDAIAAQGYDGAKVAEWLHNVNGWQGASGSVTIQKNGDRVGGPVVKIVKDGAAQSYKQ